MKKIIKLFDPYITNDEYVKVKNILKSGFWASGAGTGNVLLFEKQIKNYILTKSCVAVNSGTAALHLALSVIDIKNKQVILPSLSFVSTAHAIKYNGGIPVFADIDPKTLNIDVESVKKKITKKTKVILPVHFGGLSANLDSLKKLSKQHNCLLIEDAAHAMGANYNGKKIGSHSDIICFSFHPVKNLAMPTGGLISINNKDHRNMKNILNSRRWCGITDRKDSEYNVKELGWNYYMSEISAGIGLVQLKKLDYMNKLRRKVAKKFANEINLDNKMPYDKNSVYHFYWILVKNRNKFRQKLKQNGVETGIHYKPIHMMDFYRTNYSLPHTEEIGNSIVTLPTHPNLSDKDVKRIITLVNTYAK